MVFPELRVSVNGEALEDRDKFNNGLPIGEVDAAVNFEGICIRFDAESDELKIENGSSFIGSCSDLVA
jgi:hypothetical protein